MSRANATAVLGTCPGAHDDHQTLIAACGADHRGIVAAAHTGIGTGGTPDEDLCDLIVSNKAALYVVLQDLCGLYAHAAGIFQTVLSDDVVHLDCFLCAAELAYGSGLAPVVSVLNRELVPVYVVCGNEHFTDGSAVIDHDLTVYLEIGPGVVLVLNDNGGNVLIGGQGELEVYLLAGAVVHVEGKGGGLY